MARSLQGKKGAAPTVPEGDTTMTPNQKARNAAERAAAEPHNAADHHLDAIDAHEEAAHAAFAGGNALLGCQHAAAADAHRATFLTSDDDHAARLSQKAIEITLNLTAQ
jgi:hypothetical protein